MIRGEPLYRLQQLDLELEKSLKRIAEIKEQLGESEALRQARQALVTAETEHREWLTRTRDLELEIEGLNNRIATSEKRLYSGRITNPKELTEIQDEVASLKRRRARLEDELLAAMLRSEEAGTTLEEGRTALSDIENRWQSEQSALKEELEELGEKVRERQEERAQLRQTIRNEDLNLYDSSRERYGSIVVTTLRDGVCGLCAVAPSSTKLKRIRSGRELLQCGNCGRILLDL